MDAEQVRVRALELLKNHQLTVISTVDEVRGAPESAVVAFAERADLSIIFGTSNGSRKYQNLQKNPHVSFVTGWDPRVGSLQYEGIAKELSANEATQYVELMALKKSRLRSLSPVKINATSWLNRPGCDSLIAPPRLEANTN